MPVLDTYQELLLKIATAKAERDKLYNSLYDNNQPGGSWINAVKNECGNTFDPSKTCQDFYYPVQKPGCCPTVNLVKTRLATIAKNDSDILIWEAQVKELLKDPQLNEEIKNQQLNRKITIGVIITLVSVAVLGALYWLDKKYFHILKK